jgi:hypothetical protein
MIIESSSEGSDERSVQRIGKRSQPDRPIRLEAYQLRDEGSYLGQIQDVRDQLHQRPSGRLRRAHIIQLGGVLQGNRRGSEQKDRVFVPVYKLVAIS